MILFEERIISMLTLSDVVIKIAVPQTLTRSDRDCGQIFTYEHIYIGMHIKYMHAFT